MEEQQYQKSALDKFRQWHFWWLVVFSLLLMVTFVWYLPTRFISQFQGVDDHNVEGEADHGHEEGEDVHDHGSGEMMSGDMHEHMDEHMSEGMDMEEMMEHMGEEHMMSEDEMHEMMEEMMGHEHEEGEAHENSMEPTSSDESAGHDEGHSGDVAYHEEGDVKDGIVVNLNVNPVPYNVGVPLRMDFFVNEKPGNIPVPISTLEVEHTKKMHVVGLRSDMNEFFHIHPEESPDNNAVFTINHTFNKPGLYKIWSDVKKDGTTHLFGHPELNVNGTGPREEKNVSYGRNVISGNYQVSMSAVGTITKNTEVNLSFDIHTLNGQEVNVEDYLGAQMHLVVIKDDWSQFVHTHPVEGNDGGGHGHSRVNVLPVALADAGHDEAPSDSSSSSGGDETITFAVTFPEGGAYKAFAQFRPEGTDLPADEAITAEFWIEVVEKGPSVISEWWGLLLVSLLLMAGLSWVVNRYLKVRPEDVTVKK